jgi:16S rRNA (guanine1516-N2)-methyltransferase
VLPVVANVANTLSSAIPVKDMAHARESGLAFVLDRVDGALAICPTNSHANPLKVDFVSGRLGYRLAQGRARQETLVRAVLGNHKPEATRVLDATAGLGRDAALLAAAGCAVTMLEREPLLFVLLDDGLRRMEDQSVRDRLSLVRADACHFLSGDSLSGNDLSENKHLENSRTMFEVIYLDPMFGETSKAQVKKDLAWLKLLLGSVSATEEAELLQLARSRVTRRVVVKRGAKAPTLGAVEPTASVHGKAIRFDIYTPL